MTVGTSASICHRHLLLFKGTFNRHVRVRDRPFLSSLYIYHTCHCTLAPLISQRDRGNNKVFAAHSSNKFTTLLSRSMSVHSLGVGQLCIEPRQLLFLFGEGLALRLHLALKLRLLLAILVERRRGFRRSSRCCS